MSQYSSDDDESEEEEEEEEENESESEEADDENYPDEEAESIESGEEEGDDDDDNQESGDDDNIRVSESESGGDDAAEDVEDDDAGKISVSTNQKSRKSSVVSDRSVSKHQNDDVSYISSVVSENEESKSVEMLEMASVASSKKSTEIKSRQDNILTEAEKLRARSVFIHCSTHPKKDRIDEEQFNLALTLLGMVEKSEYVRKCFLKEQAEYIDYELFLDLLTELRVKNDVGDLVASIQNAFDAIYDGTCEFDDQRDEFGRKYILANDLRNLLTTTGLMLSVEEAGTLIRECHPVKMTSRDGISVDIIYFEQYKTMLLDNNA